ncbi:extracellular solute-binding protein [Niameybacter massiliensis]|uniref:Extracellular solute-binding protein n=1 Tax=Holtiella tumoricola TaxID=3018743 RepID=A0AA42DLA7_9FIRM|nr:extracellular solute-binding protein [Holtiella tumoricola]MDA3730856.1 extracellular solute-binding protein [Holtiella tumoricola]
MKRFKKYVALGLCTLMFSTIVPVARANTYTDTSEVATQAVLKASDYEAFLATYENAKRPTKLVEFKIGNEQQASPMIVNDYIEGMKEGVYTQEGDRIVWTAQVEEAGLYAIELEYVAEYDRGSPIQRTFYINDEIQHSGALDVEFARTYIDNPSDIGKRDQNQNEIRPSQLEVKKLQKDFVKDSMGYYSEPYLFYLEKGMNTLTIEGVSEPMTIGKVWATPLSEKQSYQDYKTNYQDKKLAGQDTIFLDAEKANYKSTPVLYAQHDRTSPKTIPYDEDAQLLNMIGGTNWSIPGQNLVWEFEVKEAGLYTIYLKAKQNYNRDFKSSRQISIDGEVPFKEFVNWEFGYQPKWQLVELGDENGAYTLYLEPGVHELKLEANLGEVTTQTRKVQDILLQLNNLYTDIMIITGATPDRMRDYRLGTLMPELTGEMTRLAEELQAVADWMSAYSGKGQNNAALEVSARQLRKMSKDADIIPRELDFFKSNNGALANWLVKVRDQSLALDYIAIVSKEDVQLATPNATFIEQFIYGFKNFLKSFSDDYATLGTTTSQTEERPSIKVWIPTGRDQAQVLRKLIDMYFTPHYGIDVDLQLVTAGSLLPATVAGIGPDVALSMGDTEPVNYAVRDAVIDLNRFADFEEVAKRFLPERMVPLTFEDKVYALPETQNFNVMFYRTDVLEELGVQVPTTWIDVVATIPILLKNNMNFALPVSVPRADLIEAGTSTYYTMLFQNGGEIYKDNGMASNIDSEIGLESFKQWTNLFVNYALPQEYDFLTRFRTGESPIVVGNFANFNTLMVSAPEIKGLWGFSLIPGTMKADGTIDHSTPISGSDCFILKNSKNYDASWEFMKWWTSAEIQVAFGKEMESILGPSARYATANLEAFGNIPWDNAFYKVLNEQMKWGRGIEQVPGGYFTGRHINNAFRKVVTGKGDIRETLLDYVYVINQELIGKRKEFGLPVIEQY